MAKTRKPATRTPQARPRPARGPATRPARVDLARRRRRTRWLVAVGAVTIITVVVVLAAVTGGSSGPASNTTGAAFDLPRLGAEGRVTLAAHKGRPTVVNMFASWCDQCDAELPGFHAAATALRGKVDFVFVNSNETGSWKGMATRHQLLDFEVARDIGGSRNNGLYRSFGGTGGMPMTAFYDADGKLLQAYPGALIGSNLTKALQQLYGVTV